MLRSQQEEQIKYFYLDRKLGGGSLGEIGEALDEVEVGLGRMRKPDLVNSLVMRMLDLMHTARSFHVKQRVARIFARHSALLATTHSRDEIAAVLAKCLKGSDQYTRIVAMQMLASLPALFLKDIAVYHTLLAKISLLNAVAIEEKKEAVLCLARLLNASPHLSRLFSKNVGELQEQYQIPLHVVIYLLTFLVIGTHLQKQILETVLFLINNYAASQLKVREPKKEIYYFQKLVVNYAASNYRIVQLYESKLKPKLPNIQATINKIKGKKYPFMKNVEQAFKDPSRLSVDEFIDELYERKKEGVRLGQYQTLILQFLKDYIRHPHELNSRLLLVFFLEEGTTYVDKQISMVLVANQHLWSKRMLKQTLSVGLFQCSRLLLQKCQLFQSNYIFLKLYIQFKLADSQSSLMDCIEIVSILHEKFSKLLECWSIINEILSAKECNGYTGHSIQPLYDSLQENLATLKQSPSFCLKQQCEILSIFLHNKNSSPAQLQNKCYYMVPGSLLYNSRFWFAYLGKQTILALFSTLL